MFSCVSEGGVVVFFPGPSIRRFSLRGLHEAPAGERNPGNEGERTGGRRGPAVSFPLPISSKETELGLLVTLSFPVSFVVSSLLP